MSSRRGLALVQMPTVSVPKRDAAQGALDALVAWNTLRREINRLKARREPCEYWTEGGDARCSDCTPCVNAGAINDEIQSKRRTLSGLRQAMQRAADRLVGLPPTKTPKPISQAVIDELVRTPTEPISMWEQRKVLDDAVYRQATAEEVAGQYWRDLEWFRMRRPHVSDNRLWVRVDPLF